ncbi:MAG: hypothetical protein IPJ65_13145 [Archangiaceae bacterium]|nr:hypothetical protein [Archangiaceae bacterium]
MSCLNCGAALSDGRCGQCRAVLGQASLASGAARRWEKRAAAGEIEAVFAMPSTSTRPQSARRGASWWVCAAVKPWRERVVLLEDLSEREAVAAAHAIAAQLEQAATASRPTSK